MSKFSTLLALLLCLTLLFGAAPAAAAPADWVVLTHCDTAEDWFGLAPGELSTDTHTYTGAPASVCYRAATTREQDTVIVSFTAPAPVNAAACTHIECDLYINDAALLSLGSGQWEFTSSGTCDAEELNYSSNYLSRRGLMAGWNHVCLPLEEGSRVSTTEASFNPAAVNYMRFYLAGLPAGTDVLLRFDNVQFTDGTAGDGSRPSGEGTSPYVAPELPTADDDRAWGDVDQNGAVNAADALRLLQYSVKLTNLTHNELAVSDVDGSGVINASDALQVLQRSVKLIEAFTVQKGWKGADRTEIGQNGAHVVHTVYPTDDVVVAVTDVVAWGAAGDGVTDDTLAFDQALTYARMQGGGTVFVPVGTYLLKGTLGIPDGVTLRGDCPPVDCGEVKGTLIKSVYGHGHEIGNSLFTLYTGAGVRDLNIYYPLQTMDNIVPYPWTFSLMGVNGMSVYNVRMVNSYKAFQFGSGTVNALQNVRHIAATVLKTGLRIDYNMDLCRLEDMIFTPDCWVGSGLGDLSGEAAMRQYVRQNATGFKVEMVDWTYMADLTVEGCAVGIHTSESTVRQAGGSPNGHMLDLHLTDCGIGLYIEYVNGIGMMVTRGEIEADLPVCTAPGFNSALSLRDMTLRAAGPHALEHAGSGMLTLGNCRLSSTADTGDGILQATGGRLSLTETTLSGPGPRIFIGENCDGLTLLNCDALSPADVAGKTAAVEWQQDADYTLPAIPEDLDYAPRRVVKPSGDTLVNLAEAPYFASRTEDCSALLQQAIDDVSAVGGGVVYVPCGTWRLDAPITVRPGVELRGSSAIPHHTTVPATLFVTDYGRGDPDGDALINLQGRAGAYGFSVGFTGQGSVAAEMTSYAAVIRGDGINTYIVNVTLVNPYIGIDLDRNRCDGHTVDGVMGAPLRYGIIMGGGSVDGLVRDVHFNPHLYSGSTPYPELPHTTIPDVFEYQMGNAKAFTVRDTVGEMMFHNFVYGALSGLAFENGADATVVGHGTDGGNQALTARGTPKRPITLVDTQLVAYGPYGSIMNYIRTQEDFTGSLTFIQTNMWGTPNRSIEAFGGQIHLAQGNVCNMGSIGVYNAAADVTVAGMTFRDDNSGFEWYIENDAIGAASYATLYLSHGGQGAMADFPDIMKGTDTLTNPLLAYDN